MSRATNGEVRGARVSWLTRVGVRARVLLTLALAIAAVVLVNWLAGRPGIRQRFDLTATSKNTLSTASLGLLERLEDDVALELLYQPISGTPEEQQLVAEVMRRSAELAELFANRSEGRIEFTTVDTTDVEGWQMRQRRLRLRGFENGIVVVSGTRVSFLRLDGDLAQINPGRPTEVGYVPPTVGAFTAEEAIVEGILDVTQGGALTAVFTAGAGEPRIDDVEDAHGIGLFAEVLRGDGFDVERWSGADGDPLPEGCDVLVVVAPKSAWPGGMFGEIVDFVERGGRLVVAPAFDPDELRASDVPDLFDRLGLTVTEGRVAAPFPDPQTGRLLQGIEQCEVHTVAARTPQLAVHPITEPFLRANRAIVLGFCHAVDYARQPEGGVAVRLVSTPEQSWLDAPPIDRKFVPGVDTRGAEGRGFSLAVSLQAPPAQEVPAPSGLDVVPETRVVAIGSDAALWNQFARSLPGGFVQAALNWVVDREHRISVPPRDPDLRLLPRDRPEAISFVTRFAQLWLPGALVAVGACVWVVRSRGSRRAPRRPHPDPR